MEPAVERREHRLRPTYARLDGPPQWSPPLNGGSTRAPMCKPALATPQWSPPLNGGSTRRRPRLVWAAVPQWSAPLNGGSTVRAGAARHVVTRRNGARR